MAAILFLIADGAITDPVPLQVRLLGEVALETASTGLTVEQISRWIHRIFDP